MKVRFLIEGRFVKEVYVSCVPDRLDTMVVDGDRYKVREVILNIDKNQIDIETYKEVTHI